MIWTDAIELCEFERRGWLYPDELSLIYRTDCARRTALLARRVQLERHRTLALWHVFAGARGDGRYTATLDELVYGNARAMHELVALRVELDKLRARVYDFSVDQHVRCRTDVLWRYRLRLARLEAEAWRELVRERECAWAKDSDGNWDTLCGHCFVLESGTPRDNDMEFCCYCGGSLEQVEYIDEANQERD